MKLGMNATLWNNEDVYATPDWAEVKNIMDLNVSDSMEEADVSTRSSAGFTETEPTLRNVEITFQMVKKVDDLDVALFRTAYTTRAALDLRVLDMGEVDGSLGRRGWFKVFNFSESQELRNVVLIDVTLKPCAATETMADYEYVA